MELRRFFDRTIRASFHVREIGAGTRTRTATILLVDDQDDLRAVARDTLAAAGYTVLEAQDGPAALRLAQETSGAIELLLTDVVMPHLSGRELAEDLVRLRPATKVLYMSGHTDDTILRHGVSGFSVALLPKPFRPALLLQTVRAVLDGGLQDLQASSLSLPRRKDSEPPAGAGLSRRTRTGSTRP